MDGLLDMGGGLKQYSEHRIDLIWKVMLRALNSFTHSFHGGASTPPYLS